MSFHKPTSGDRRTAGGEDRTRGGFPVERPPVSNPPGREAGRDRRPGGSKPPRVGETWRHLRTGQEAKVVHRVGDAVLTSFDGSCWPIDFFMQKWERA